VRVRASEKTGGVEGVDAHVEEQGMRHLATETADVLAQVVVGVQDADWTGLARDEVAQRVQVRVEPPVLTHHVQHAGLFCSRYHLPRLRHGRRHGLLAEHRQPAGKSRQRDVVMRLRR
jgi:hypothetical protein